MRYEREREMTTVAHVTSVAASTYISCRLYKFSNTPLSILEILFRRRRLAWRRQKSVSVKTIADTLWINTIFVY